MFVNQGKPNRLGWVTSLSYSFDDRYADITSLSDSYPNMLQTNSLVRASVDFVAQDYGALQEFMQELSRGSISSPVFQKEFMCLYCGSPNKIERTHCKKCGAPRSFVIG